MREENSDTVNFQLGHKISAILVTYASLGNQNIQGLSSILQGKYIETFDSFAKTNK